MRALPLVIILLLFAGPAAAQDISGNADDEAAIRAVIAQWYEELAKAKGGNPRTLTAPGFIDATPYYKHLDTGAASLGPRIYVSLAARALTFAHDVEHVRIDPNFAKVDVWERGYFYASAAEKTYESAASTLFVLERQPKDGRWLILAHQSGSYGIPPNKITSPMPDLRDLYYATQGKARDPDADGDWANPAEKSGAR